MGIQEYAGVFSLPNKGGTAMNCPECGKEALTITEVTAELVVIVCTNPQCKNRGQRVGVKVKK